LWHVKFEKFPKTAKYSLGAKIDNLFLETIEAVAVASFLSGLEKLPYIKSSIGRVDTLKVFLQLAWEMKLINTEFYANISEQLINIGRMLGGWYGKTLKQNSPSKPGEKYR